MITGYNTIYKISGTLYVEADCGVMFVPFLSDMIRLSRNLNVTVIGIFNDREIVCTPTDTLTPLLEKARKILGITS